MKNTNQAAPAETPPLALPVVSENIPPELKALPQWVLWKYVWRATKWTKPPYQPDGQVAKVNDPATWTTYDAAMHSYQSSGWDGIGSVVTDQDGFAGIDLDKCLDENGTPEPWAQKIVDAIPSYWEVSPSGRGLRAWCQGKLPQGGRKQGKIEMYDVARYLTVTGHVFGEYHEITDCTAELAAVHAKVFASDPPPRQQQRQENLSDSDLLDKIRKSKQGSEFERLWNGGSGGDHSADDLALCNMLAFWTGKDANKIDALFRQSGLMREKWDEKHSGDGRTYGQINIDKAIALVARAAGVHTEQLTKHFKGEEQG